MNQLLNWSPPTASSHNVFKRPPMLFRPGVLFPILCADDLLDLVDKFKDLKSKGIGRVAPWFIPASRYQKYTGSTLNIDDDSPEYWAALKTIQDAADAVGISVILHDENGWPSGQAGGRILKKGGRKWMRQRLQPTASKPWNTEPLEKGSINPDTPQPDLLNPEVGAAVVDFVHNKHKEQLGGSLPECMPWVYADEPTFGGIGHDPITEFIWTTGLEQQFIERYGYSIEPFIAELTDQKRTVLPRKTAQARIDYFDLLAYLFESNYLRPIFQWCERNQVASGGHLLLEHDPRRFMEGGCGHLLRSFRYFHIPGIDSIFQESHPHKRSHHFPKYASSIARQTGRLCSSMPFGASSCAVTPAIFKWTIDHELVRGINLFLPWGYSPNNDIHYQWSRPVFGHYGPLWEYMDIAYNYTARMSYVLSIGKPECRTALYFDMRSIWAGEPWKSQAIAAQEVIAQSLLETQHDFDFVDDLALKQATVSDNAELVVGNMCYDTLIIPPTDWMETAAHKNVQHFIAAGGTVLSQGTPNRPLLRTTNPQQMMRVCKRISQDEALYFIVNEGNTTINTDVLFDEENFPQRLIPESGECDAVHALCKNGKIHVALKLAPWESCVLRFAKNNTATTNTRETSKTALENWSLGIINETSIRNKKIVSHTTDSIKFLSGKLGDWSDLFGPNFCGTVRYRSEFKLTDIELKNDWVLDLGNVNYACSLRLNDTPIDRKAWSPFHFLLPSNLLLEKNIIEIDVTNTLSNLFTSIEYQKHIESIYSKEGARYVHQLKPWEEATRPSGLMGPVTIQSKTVED